MNNFGDLMGPILVNEILATRGLVNQGSGRLLTIGSIMHFSRPGDVIWGTGINGNDLDDCGGAPDLDVRAVRGPMTRTVLIDWGVPNVPEIYGDPALLWSHFWPRQNYIDHATPMRKHVVIRHLGDRKSSPHEHKAINARSRLSYVVKMIANSELVVSSSLHGIILAESFGIPARMFLSTTEHNFKFSDYYLGTGRRDFTPAKTANEAIEMGGEPAGTWDTRSLLDAFPSDIFHAHD